MWPQTRLVQNAQVPCPPLLGPTRVFTGSGEPPGPEPSARPPWAAGRAAVPAAPAPPAPPAGGRARKSPLARRRTRSRSPGSTPRAQAVCARRRRHLRLPASSATSAGCPARTESRHSPRSLGHPSGGGPSGAGEPRAAPPALQPPRLRRPQGGVFMDASSPRPPHGGPPGPGVWRAGSMSPIRKPSGVVTQKLQNTGSGGEVSRTKASAGSCVPWGSAPGLPPPPRALKLGAESRLRRKSPGV